MAGRSFGVKRTHTFDLSVRLFTVFFLVFSALALPTNLVRGDETTPPAAPTGLTAAAGNGYVDLSWTANTELDLLGYNVYRDTSPISDVELMTPLNGGTLISESATTYHDAAVDNGTTYYYVITAVNDFALESDESEGVSAEPDGTAPAIPTGFTATAGNGYVDLSWTSNGEGDLAGYNIYRDTDSGVPLTSPLNGGTPQAGTTYHDTAVVNGNTYYYVVTAEDEIGNESGASSEENATPDGTAPAIPTGFTATAGNGYVDLSWTANGEGDLAGYNIYRDTDSGVPLTSPLNGGTPQSGNTYHDTAVVNGTTYYYVITAEDEIGNESSASEEKSAKPADSTIPNPPTGFTATAGNGYVDLSWTANTELDLAGYNIYRGTSPGVLLTSPLNGGTPQGATTYHDTAVVNGNTYYYVITAEDDSGNESGASSEENATPDGTAPAIPTGFTATAGNGYVDLSWTANIEGDLAGYNIYRDTDSGVPLTSPLNGGIPQAGTTYHDTAVVNGTTYYYVITAEDEIGNESGASNEENATPDGTAPAIPTGFTATAGNGYVDLSWMANGESDLAGYNIYRGTSSGVSLVSPLNGGTPQAATTYHDTAVVNGTTYYYVVTAEDEIDNESGASSEESAKPDGSAPTDPVGLLATAGDGYVDLSWTANTELDLAGYNIYRGTSPGVLLASPLNGGTPQGATTYHDTAVVNGNTYYYVVTAEDTIGNESGASNEVSATPVTPPNPPTLVSPSNGATDVSVEAPLSVNATNPEGGSLTVSFYGRPKTDVDDDFTLILIPDPQHYAEAYPEIYYGQMDWTVTQKISRNIKYVLTVGDLVDDYTSTVQWDVAVNAWDILSNAGIPFGLELGNTDGAPYNTSNFNTYFGSTVFDQVTYGGRFGTNYDNTYHLFSVSGYNFIVIFLEYDYSMTSSSPVLAWADDLLQSNSSRRAIVVTHYLLNDDAENTFAPQGALIYEALKENPNLFMLLGGHNDTAGMRTDVYNENTVYSLRSDYQTVDDHQSGYLRIMRFSPSADTIYVTTYSPTQDKWRTASNEQFNLAYTMDDGGDFSLLGTKTVTSGSNAALTWKGLSNNTEYEWYAVADNGDATAQSVTWSFTTEEAANVPPVLTNPGAQTGLEGDVVNLPVTAVDIDSATLTYSAGNLPDGVTINPTTGVISGTLTSAAANSSPYSSSVTVSDGSLLDTENFTWTVTQTPSIACGTDASLMRCWQMEEGSGSVLVDGSANGKDAGIYGTPVWVTGKTGQALDLSGTGQYALGPDGDSLDMTTAITLTGWIRPEKTASQVILKKTQGTAASGYGLTLGSNNKISFQINGGASSVASLTNYPTDGTTWQHVAATFDGTSLKIYINGILDNSTAITSTTMGLNATALGIGSQPDGTTLYQGALDDVRIYNRTFTMAEIQTLIGIAPVTLTVNKAGAGLGSVTSDVAGIDCGTDCSEAYPVSQAVTLTAVASAGYKFTGWSGACTGTGTCSVTMDAAKSVTATFEVYTPAISGNTDVAGVTLSYTDGTPKTATSDGSGNYSFTVTYNWSGTVTPSLTGYYFEPASIPYTNVITDQTAQDYTATTFTYGLSVSKTGSGTGTVTSNVAGIDCGSDCAQSYDYGTVVVLTATPTDDYNRLIGWSGGGCSGTGTCTVTIEGVTSVTAEFEEATFADVPFNHPRWAYVQALWDAGYTAGCQHAGEPLAFCPDSTMLRTESAVFMLRGSLGAIGTPTDAEPYVFTDDWTGYDWAIPWAEKMYDEGMTAGCQYPADSPLKFCPSTAFTRDMGAVFGLRIAHGSGMEIPVGVGDVFDDVPAEHWAVGWVEQAYDEGLIPACSTDPLMFCPSEQLTRSWAAYIIVNAKGLTLPD